MLSVEQIALQIVALVVDDNIEHQGSIGALLRHLGAKDVLTAASGREAMTLLKAPARPIDIVLAEVRMGDGNGMQLLQAVRCGHAKSLRANSTFILTTSQPEVGIIQTASSLDANGFLVKPIKLEKLEAAVIKARRTIFPPNIARYTQVFIPETF